MNYMRNDNFWSIIGTFGWVAIAAFLYLHHPHPSGPLAIPPPLRLFDMLSPVPVALQDVRDEREEEDTRTDEDK